MNFHEQGRPCHAERSEASLCQAGETLPLRFAQGFGYFAQGDTTSPINYYWRGYTHYTHYTCYS